MLTYRTLFSGGELFGAGARQAGWQHVDGYEIDDKVAQVARLNSFDVRTADVCALDYASLPSVDHLHVSPSCKNASRANVDASETPDDLACADAICRAIVAHAGRSFSLENVQAYRAFGSYARILATLRRCGYAIDERVVNAADYGVPQTRKRLIVRAVRGVARVPSLHPTHCKHGDMFSPAWVGWYAAIEDLLDTLPATQPAPWQVARLPAQLRSTTLFANNESHDRHGRSYGATGRSSAQPALTLSTASAGWWHAFLVEGQTYNGDVMRILDADRPDRSICASEEKRVARALLIDGDNSRGDEGRLTCREEDEPAMTMRSTRAPVYRAYASRWVRMTVQALGRFQTVPDDYKGLTAQINGNGVPCLLAQRIMESLAQVQS